MIQQNIYPNIIPVLTSLVELRKVVKGDRIGEM